MVRTLKFLLLVSMSYLPLLGTCQNIDSYFPFDIEINYLGGTIRNEASIESKEIIKLNPGESVCVLELIEYPFFKIKYQNIIGYISTSSFKTNEFLDKVNGEIEKERLSGKRKEIEIRKKRLLSKDLIGEIAPDFMLKNLEGNTFKLSDYLGRIILIEFWGAGCGACIRAAKEVEKYTNYFKENNVKLIIIECTKETSLDKVITIKEKFNVNEKTLYGGEEISKVYGVKGFPSFFLLDKNGKIIFTHVGADLFELPFKEDLFNLIEKL